MSRVSYTAEGFRAAFRRPSLTLAEIIWRWTVGVTAGALLIFAAIEYFATLPVNSGELLLLRTRLPFLVSSAISHILHGNLNRAVLAGLLTSLAIGGLWILAASIGRAVTVRELLDYFAVRRKLARDIPPGLVPNAEGRDTAPNVPAEASSKRPLRALVTLNSLRAALTLAALLGFLGAALLAGFASPNGDPQPGLAFFLFLPLGGAVCWIWGGLNWLLSLAGVFAVRDDEGAIGATSAAVTFCREHPGPVFAVSLWTGLAHFTTFAFATAVVFLPLGLVRVVPGRVVVVGMILVMLAYFASADWLYMARLAGYVCIAEMPDTLLVPVPLLPAPPYRRDVPPVETRVDQEEPILSDVPSLAAES